MIIRKTKNTIQYAIIYDLNINGKRTAKIYDSFSTLDKIELRFKDEEPTLKPLEKNN